MPATRLAAKSRRSRANYRAQLGLKQVRREQARALVETLGNRRPAPFCRRRRRPGRTYRRRRRSPVALGEKSLQGAGPPGHRLQRATRLARSNQDPTPLKVLQPLFDRRRFRLDGPDFGYRLAAIGDRDCLPLANLPDHLGEPRRGFVDRIADAHARQGNQSDGPNGDPGPLGVANLAGVTFASARGIGGAYRSRTRRRPAAIRVRSRLGAWPALSSR